MLGLVAVAVYVGAEILPPYMANYQFQDYIDTEARLGTYSTKGEDTIRDSVFKKAQDLDMPISKEQIKVQHSGEGSNSGVMIEVDYNVHVDLPGYPVDLEFHPATKNKRVF
jgi:hypothetical protein